MNPSLYQKGIHLIFLSKSLGNLLFICLGRWVSVDQRILEDLRSTTQTL